MVASPVAADVGACAGIVVHCKSWRWKSKKPLSFSFEEDEGRCSRVWSDPMFSGRGKMKIWEVRVGGWKNEVSRKNLWGKWVDNLEKFFFITFI